MYSRAAQTASPTRVVNPVYDVDSVLCMRTVSALCFRRKNLGFARHEPLSLGRVLGLSEHLRQAHVMERIDTYGDLLASDRAAGEEFHSTFRFLT